MGSHDLAAFLDVSPTIRTPHAMAAALTALISLGCVRVEESFLGEMLKAEARSRPSAAALRQEAPASGQLSLELEQTPEMASQNKAPAAEEPEAESVPQQADAPAQEEALPEADASAEASADVLPSRRSNDFCLEEEASDSPVRLEEIRGVLNRPRCRRAGRNPSKWRTNGGALSLFCVKTQL